MSDRFPTDGVYTIKNTGRDLMLDLTSNSTAEGNQIQGYHRNDTVAQEWVMKRQESQYREESNSGRKTYSIQSNNNGNNGNGCFATATHKRDEPVVYTRQSILVDLFDRSGEEARHYFTMSFTLADDDDILLSIPSANDNAVILDRYIEDCTHQQWKFIKVSDLQPIGK